MKIVMENIHKSFGSNNVLEGVDFSLEPGEIHALMGENGAGKSTLMNILTGLFPSNQGSITIDGVKTQYKDSKESEQAGIAFIRQELNILPQMTVLENLFIGKEMTNSFGFLREKVMKEKAEEVFSRLDFSIPFDKEAGECSVGEQQLIEIAKALMLDAKIIIMDEPTAALTDREIDKLFEIMKELTQQGVALVYISHRMEEIFAICDRITVMRDGISVKTSWIKDTNYNEIVKQMVGRELDERYPERTPTFGKPVLQVNNFSRKGYFNDIKFSVREGEILGVSGLMGAGRTEIMRAIFGIDEVDQGEILLDGKKLTIKDPTDAMKAGLAFITENRKDEGLVLDFSIRENIGLSNLNSFSNKGFIKGKDEKDFVELMIKRLQIKTQTQELPVGNLSGGNQQKVVIAKWVGTSPRVLIMDEPTRGIDVGAKREIYQLMNELTERGLAIIMISSDLPEVLGMSDRIMVIHEGEISGELVREEATQEKIMTYATGGNGHE
ncbi:sugar ABC transporter ATP-binding protein [Oceanobacillus iheyensis]|uniref:Ribose import ATP-binding protein RbsA n=1 Tax=Oceanobacillus iheyensis (strain DSM 14371 / CIP 107618 / JCM 11309 / KCTC 3954 / HTE831) TaxID=221109 RepID=RBSA_OCEIH|nr:sugar ABC transporter ATP-binding protein [Oceanobacillus iheyensis]Q8ENB3.1 RecName: Full=Ribose import ATP-binding protein RbsA [Oceanobacillus iheyensis HTE831]BAC14530.1 ribose ABC transporter ATP-binding protein [Oceanobacillus iheyensis HTE831]